MFVRIFPGLRRRGSLRGYAPGCGTFRRSLRRAGGAGRAAEVFGAMFSARRAVFGTIGWRMRCHAAGVELVQWGEVIRGEGVYVFSGGAQRGEDRRGEVCAAVVLAHRAVVGMRRHRCSSLTALRRRRLMPRFFLTSGMSNQVCFRRRHQPTSLAIIRPSVTGTALPNWRMVSDHDPWKT